ncbi:TetR/AcrR family transcriptional regulator [Luteibacter pinisoli]|nr:TetR/AcrR family transcriptional regulator [Luteibacter pinisoli]
MTTNMRESIMAAARVAVQHHGYNALSFRELAKDVGVKSASVHYYFPTKGDLASALAKRYADEAEVFLEELQATPREHRALMDVYTSAFRKALADDNKMCLCGIMAAEYNDLPDIARVEVDRFTAVNTHWLRGVLQARHPDTEPHLLDARALAIFAAIEGAQLVARGRADIDAFDNIIEAYHATGLFD